LGADALQAIHPNLGLVLVAVAMAVGGIANARKVAETMSRNITRINPGQGFTGNLVTASLVVAASIFKLPVSTTHVSVGSLFGIAVVNGNDKPRPVLNILRAWGTTFPRGALLGAALYWALF